MRRLTLFQRRLLLIALLAFGVRAAFLIQMQGAFRTPERDPYLQGVPDVSAAEAGRRNGERGYFLQVGIDTATYVRLARMVLGGRILAEDVTVTPLTPLVALPAFLALAGDSVYAAMFLHALLGVAQVVLLALLGRRLGGERVGLLAGLGGAMYRLFIIYDVLPLTETVINASLLAAVLLWTRLCASPSLRRGLAFGGALGIAILAKPTMVLLAPLLLLVRCAEGGRAGLRGLLRPLAFAAALTVLILFPFILRTCLLSGEWIFLRGNGGYSVLMGNHPGASGAFDYPKGEYAWRLREATAEDPSSVSLRDRAALRLALGFWKERPREAFAILLRKIMLWIHPREIPNNVSFIYLGQVSFLGWPAFLTSRILWPLAALGAVLLLGNWRRWSIAYGFVLAYSLLLVNLYVVARYRLPVALFLILFAAAALEWLYHRGQQLDRKRMLALAAVIGLALWFSRGEIARLAVPAWHANGLRSEGPRGGIICHDGFWNPEERPDAVPPPFRAALRDPRGSIVKEIRLLPSEAAGAGYAEILFWADTANPGGGEVEILFNDSQRALLRLEREARSGLRPWRVPVDPKSLLAVNRIALRVKPGATLSVPVGDRYDFGRSRASRHGEPPGAQALDPVRYRQNHCLHLPRGELQIALVLRDGPPKE